MLFLRSMQRKLRAFTLIELLVVIAIIAILIGLLVPAVQKVRAAAARMSTTNNLHQIAIAAHNFHDTYSYIPNNGDNGGVTTNPPACWCWGYQILPFVEQQALHDNLLPIGVGVKSFMCPGRSHTPASTAGGNGQGLNPNITNNNGPHTDYAICATWFNSNSSLKITMSVITSLNGSSNTIYVGEKSMDPGNYGNTGSNNWDEVVFSGGYGGTGRSDRYIYRDAPGVNFGNQWGSPFAGGCPFAMCDGSVRMINYTLSGSNDFANAQNYANNVPINLNQ